MGLPPSKSIEHSLKQSRSSLKYQPSGRTVATDQRWRNKSQARVFCFQLHKGSHMKSNSIFIPRHHFIHLQHILLETILQSTVPRTQMQPWCQGREGEFVPEARRKSCLVSLSFHRVAHAAARSSGRYRPATFFHF